MCPCFGPSLFPIQSMLLSFEHQIFLAYNICPCVWLLCIKALDGCDSWHTWQEIFPQVLRSMMATALKDQNNQRFLTLSESCVPMYSALVIYQQLMHETRSRISACSEEFGRMKMIWNERYIYRYSYTTYSQWNFSHMTLYLYRNRRLQIYFRLANFGFTFLFELSNESCDATKGLPVKPAGEGAIAERLLVWQISVAQIK